MTNAHCVEHASTVLLRREKLADKYEARVLAVVHHVDLAILTVVDDAFWVDAREIQLSSKLPQLQVREIGSSVSVCRV
jgi:hypothetical protein